MDVHVSSMDAASSLSAVPQVYMDVDADAAFQQSILVGEPADHHHQQQQQQLIYDPTQMVTHSPSQYMHQAVDGSGEAAAAVYQTTTAAITAATDDSMMLVPPHSGVPSVIVSQQQQQEEQQQQQQDLEVEPIDLEEVHKIQARMPAADPNAPIGSNKNPIRIIQQGNQYITTQDVSDEHLQQIIQVLTNQALISRSGSRPSTIYNRHTNRRIVFRVTRAKRRNNNSNNSEEITTGGKLSTKNAALDRQRFKHKRRRRWEDGATAAAGGGEDPDFEPEAPEEEVLPFPLARQSSSAAGGRVSKPPKHLVCHLCNLHPLVCAQIINRLNIDCRLWLANSGQGVICRI